MVVALERSLVCSHPSRKGIVLVLTMILMVVCVTMAVSLSSLTATNLQLADNHRVAHRALANAQSGLEVMRYWLDQATVSVTTDPNQLIQGIASLCGLLSAMNSRGYPGNRQLRSYASGAGSSTSAPVVTRGSLGYWRSFLFHELSHPFLSSQCSFWGIGATDHFSFEPSRGDVLVRVSGVRMSHYRD